MNAPSILQDKRGWLVWKFVKTPGDKKPRKVPYYVGGGVRSGTQGGAEDREKLASYAEAVRESESGKWAGIGFAMLPDWGLVALDFDDALDPDGNLLPAVESLIAGTYAEWSPSGKGVHAFMRGAIADKKSHADGTRFGFETFCGQGFLTFTGSPIPICELLGAEDTVADLTPEVVALFGERFPNVSTKGVAIGDDDPLMTYNPPLGVSDDEMRDWLSYISADCDYLKWLHTGMALHHETEGDSRGLDLWDEWSQGEDAGHRYPGRELLEAKWDGFGRDANRAMRTMRSVRREALQIKHKDDIVLDPKDFMETARIMLATDFQGDEGNTLLRNRGLWYRHVGPHWEELPDEELRAHYWRWLDKAKKHVKGPGDEITVQPFKPGKSQIDAGLDALRAVSIIPQAVAPCWLPGYSGADPADLISLANGIIHVESRRLLPHTAAYFTHNSLPYGWDDECSPDEWLRFLDEVFPGDQESKDTLQEMFGYLLTADTSQQKIFLLLGPKRSGKGTIGRVLGALVGQSNIVCPTLTSLTGTFGLQPLINKLVALVPDARVSRQSNTQAIVEKLLMVSGEDNPTVDRKNKESWSGKLTSRFVILTNETPQLGDASGALSGRFITLHMRQSFYGREDPSLGARLRAELPGIFRWALDGLDRLRARGYFVQPASGKEAQSEMEDLNSPVAAFVRQRCEIGPGKHQALDMLYEAWREWCSEEGRPSPWDKSVFAKSLRAAFCEIEVGRPREDGAQVRTYFGICLKQHVKDAMFCTEESLV